MVPPFRDGRWVSRGATAPRPAVAADDGALASPTRARPGVTWSAPPRPSPPLARGRPHRGARRW